jgi:hypothetical protein
MGRFVYASEKHVNVAMTVVIGNSLVTSVGLGMRWSGSEGWAWQHCPLSG